MGSPLSPVVVGLFMEDFEQTALVTADREPKLWFRYVNDTLIVWPHRRTQLATFMDHLNGLCYKIQFTMEIEEENQLPFLDVLVKRNKNTLTTSVFCKKTHTNRYLHFRSHHHPHIKTSVVSCLKVKGRTGVRRRRSQGRTESSVKGVPGERIPTCSYSRGTQQEMKSPHLHKHRGRWREVAGAVLRLSEKVCLVCRHLNIKTAFRSSLKPPHSCQGSNSPRGTKVCGVPCSLQVWLSLCWRDREAEENVY